jgi:hypothetical protein
MSDIPEQVLREAEEADAELEAIKKARQADLPPAITLEPKPDEATPQQMAQPQAQPTETKTVQQQAPADTQVWQDRLNTANGWLKEANERNKRLEDELRKMQSTLSDLTSKIVSRQEQQPQTPQTQGDPQEFRKYIDPKLVEEYGEDWARGTYESYKRMQSGTQAELDALKARLAEVDGNARKMAGESEYASFLRNLDGMCPGAAVMQERPTPEFLKWLDEPDELTGETRRSVAEGAFAAKNIRAVAGVFKKYMQSLAAKPAAQSAPVSQALPASSGQGSPAPEKPIYTEASVERFYDEVRRNMWDDRLSERNKIEKQIEEAYKEGRVR